MSVGRGTNFPFGVIGYPELKGSDFSFTPETIKGVCEHPLYENTLCHGYDLRKTVEKNIVEKREINLTWLIEMYKKYPKKNHFFNGFFNKLAGNIELQKQIRNGVKIEDIRKSWQKDLNQFRQVRKKYLLYEDF